MSGGFDSFAKKVMEKNRALKNSTKRIKHLGGKSKGGDKPLIFRKANKEMRDRINYEKKLIQHKIKFRIYLLVVVALLISLFALLFLPF